MEHDVTSCSNCPLFNGWKTYCNHPIPAKYIHDSESLPPEDCPLHAKKLIIYFKE